MTVFVLMNDHSNLLGVYSSIENCDNVMSGLGYKKVTDEYGDIEYDKEEIGLLGAKMVKVVYLYAFELDEENKR